MKLFHSYPLGGEEPEDDELLPVLRTSRPSTPSRPSNLQGRVF